MKSQLVLLLTRDVELEHESATAGSASGARLMLPRTVGEALQSICEHGREIGLVVINFDNGYSRNDVAKRAQHQRDQCPLWR